LSFANEYVGDVTIPTQVIKYNQFFSRRISQSDGSFHIKLNYTHRWCHVQGVHLECGRSWVQIRIMCPSGAMSTHGLLFHWASTIKIHLSRHHHKQGQNLANSNVQKDVSLNILQGRHGQVTFKKQIGHGNWVQIRIMCPSGAMSTHGLLFHWASTIKIHLSRHHHRLIEM
jgi:hypothetical protein